MRCIVLRPVWNLCVAFQLCSTYFVLLRRTLHIQMLLAESSRAVFTLYSAIPAYRFSIFWGAVMYSVRIYLNVQRIQLAFLLTHV